MRLTVDQDHYLIANQFSGSVVLVKSKWWEKIGIDQIFFHNNNETPALINDVSRYKNYLLASKLATIDEVKILEELGFLLGDAMKNHFDQNLRNFASMKKSNRVTMIYFTPTVKCPLGCVYCFENHDRSQGKKTNLEIDDLNYIEQTIDLYCAQKKLNPNKISLVLFGGEPLVPSLKEFNKGIFELAEKKGFYLDVVTSGANLDDFYLDLLSKHKNRLREIDITLDGSKVTHNKMRPWKNGSPTFDTIKNNVDTFLRNGIRVMVKVNFGKDTLNTIEDLLDLIIDWQWFDSPYFLFTTNIIRSFGNTNTMGQEIPEELSILKILEIFKKKPYKDYLSKVRVESLKITDYLSNSLDLLRYENSGNMINKFNSQPKYAFCHPDDGTMFNISYDGEIYACNWAAGKNYLSQGNIFKNFGKEFCEKESVYPLVIDKEYCKNCDLSTFCGGGCPIDKTEAGIENFHKTCRGYYYETLTNFIQGVFKNGWSDQYFSERNIVPIRNGFNFEYKYEGRIERQSQIV